MILYTDTVYNYIVQSIKLQIAAKNKSSILCVVTGGSDSIINAAINVATALVPVYLIFVGYKKEQENEFENWINKTYPNRCNIIKPEFPSFSDLNLDVDTKSSMIPAYVDMYCRNYNCLSLGAITKSEYSLVKFYKAITEDCFDYYPLIDLYKSECKQLAAKIGVPESLQNVESITEKSFGFSFDELEWLDKENDNLNIVTGINFPNMAPHWALYNDSKKLLVTKVYQLNKINKNKVIPDTKKCLVRTAFPNALS